MSRERTGAEIKRAAEDEEFMKTRTRDKHVGTDGNMWGVAPPREVTDLLLCDDSWHGDEHQDPFLCYFWIAIRLTEDEEAYEIVRIENDGRIVEHYKGRLPDRDAAIFAANTLRKNWNEPINYPIGRALTDERDLTRNLKLNPWGRAVWERKHPSGPVLVIWHLEPLPLYIATWLPFAGSRCIPSPVNFTYVVDPTHVAAAIDVLGESAFSSGPSTKMTARSQSISASYAANGKKGGRPKKASKKVSDFSTAADSG